MITELSTETSRGMVVATGFRIASGSEADHPVAGSRTSIELAFQSQAMAQTCRIAKRYARSSADVLITGESGTGKEVFSRFLHQQSDRHACPFVAVNCAALSETLFESELFGHRKGAFTGAAESRTGVFEHAGGGILLLDEISEIPIALQAKLLRVLEQREVQPVGGNHTVAIDVRVIATTNRDLQAEVKAGRFRPDLFHRLNVLELELPPLRERVSDIPLLASYFIRQFRHESDSDSLEIGDAAMQRLTQYAFPGNVRELRNMIYRACVVADCDMIQPEDLPDRIEGNHENKPGDSESLFGLSLADAERKMILAALKKFNGDKKQASAELGVTSRTLSNKIKQYLDEGLISPSC